MKKNDEQKVNKLKKEKVKKEKTKKIPKRDNASRKEKKINIKASPGGQKGKNRKSHSIAALRCGWLGLF